MNRKFSLAVVVTGLVLAIGSGASAASSTNRSGDAQTLQTGNKLSVQVYRKTPLAGKDDRARCGRAIRLAANKLTLVSGRCG